MTHLTTSAATPRNGFAIAALPVAVVTAALAFLIGLNRGNDAQPLFGSLLMLIVCFTPAVVAIGFSIVGLVVAGRRNGVGRALAVISLVVTLLILPIWGVGMLIR